MAKKASRPSDSVDDFQSVVREAMELRLQIDKIDAIEQRAKARAARSADAKRNLILPAYDALMERVMTYIKSVHPEILKGGDQTEFTTDELTVRFYKDGNGTLEYDSVDALIKYLRARPELRSMVKVILKFVGATELKKWMRAHPSMRPPARIAYNDSILLIRNLTPSQVRRGVEPMTIKRAVSKR